MRLIRFFITLALLGAAVWFAVSVPLGDKTLWQHLRAIAGSKESQDLVKGVKQKAGSALKRDAGRAADPKQSSDDLTPDERKELRRLIRGKLRRDAG